jgi:PhzF family phenazine biosynthesis protein
VCLADAPLPPRERQAIAAEQGLPATAFPTRRADGGFDLRWHGPTEELAFCGHGTLAAASVLWTEGRAPIGELRFDTPAGPLAARPNGDDVELDLPAVPVVDEPLPEGLREALGVEPLEMARGGQDALLLLASPDDVRRAGPDFERLAALPLRGAILTAAGGEHEADVTSRFFAPAVGIPEDPATGSAHCLLGPWWAGRLGRDELSAHQASERGGLLRVRVRGERVLVAGRVEPDV